MIEAIVHADPTRLGRKRRAPEEIERSKEAAIRRITEDLGDDVMEGIEELGAKLVVDLILNGPAQISVGIEARGTLGDEVALGVRNPPKLYLVPHVVREEVDRCQE